MPEPARSLVAKIDVLSVQRLLTIIKSTSSKGLMPIQLDSLRFCLYYILTDSYYFQNHVMWCMHLACSSIASYIATSKSLYIYYFDQKRLPL